MTMSKKFHRPGRDFKAGEIFETGWWFAGPEYPEAMRKFKRDAENMLAMACEYHGRTHKPPKFYWLRPGEDRCPLPDCEIKGEDVRFLVMEAEIIEKVVYSKSPTPFVDDLPENAKRALRAATRRVHERNGGLPITDEQCDKLIEEHGPDTALKLIEKPQTESIH